MVSDRPEVVFVLAAWPTRGSNTRIEDGSRQRGRAVLKRFPWRPSGPYHPRRWGGLVPVEPGRSARGSH